MKKVAKNSRISNGSPVADCPYCEKTFRFDEDAYATEGSCPYCNKDYILPNEDGSEPDEESVGRATLRQIGRAIMEDDEVEEKPDEKGGCFVATAVFCVLLCNCFIPFVS